MDSKSALDASQQPLCPKAEDVPAPLMDEYLKLVKGAPKQITWEINQNKLADRDYYWVEGPGKSMYVGVAKNADPHDPKIAESIKYLGNVVDDPLDRRDQYEHGQRTEMSFTSKYPTGKVFVSVTFDSINGKEHVATEFGSIYKATSNGSQHAGYFDVKFDRNGKVIDYSAGQELGNLVPTQCLDK
jgi:hypothetical protein